MAASLSLVATTCSAAATSSRAWTQLAVAFFDVTVTISKQTVNNNPHRTRSILSSKAPAGQLSARHADIRHRRHSPAALRPVREECVSHVQFLAGLPLLEARSARRYLGIWISFGTTQRATADRPWLEATMACSTQVHLNQTLTIIVLCCGTASCMGTKVLSTLDGIQRHKQDPCLRTLREKLGRDRSAPDQPGRHQHEPHLRDEPRRARPERKEEGEQDVRRPHHPCRARRSSSRAHETGVPSNSQGREPAEPAAAAERQRPGNRRRRGDPGAGARAGGGDAAHNRGPLLYRVCSRPQLLRSCVPVARVFDWIFFQPFSVCIS
ncbi:uncharacterized protein [Zea mays]|uniref:uncharacterized protein isoform X2 n=1 Tax=Zea mays TaxID=4577 RepID=UPI0004DEAC7B|nr:uncharacterized protein LOC100217207 isoform X2 [Zea mays]|eukprot:XP_023158189.1 uncharacterized protein LOC100217207 isoform X2 [Zea mays]